MAWATKQSNLILTIHFLSIFYISLLFSFVIDVQILRKFSSNAMIGLSSFLMSTGSLASAFVTPYLNKIPIKILLYSFISISNIFSYLFSLLRIYSLYINVSSLFFTSQFFISFFSTIISITLSYYLVEPLSKKDRNTVLTAKGFLGTLAHALGRLTTFALFSKHKDNWEFKSQRNIFILSQVVFTIKFFLIFVFIFKYFNKKWSTNDIERRKNETTLVPQEEYDISVPYFVLFSKMAFSIGSGLSVKYFIVYMIDKFRLKPTQISLTSSFSPFLLLVFLILIKKISDRFGKAVVVIITKFFGFILLIFFILSNNLFLSLFLFTIRYPIQNCTFPLVTSIMLDNTPKDTYLYWIASKKIVDFIRHVAIIVGGVIADKHGYNTSFMTTCFLYVIGQILFFYPLYSEVKGKYKSNDIV